MTPIRTTPAITPTLANQTQRGTSDSGLEDFVSRRRGACTVRGGIGVRAFFFATRNRIRG